MSSFPSQASETLANFGVGGSRQIRSLPGITLFKNLTFPTSRAGDAQGAWDSRGPGQSLLQSIRRHILAKTFSVGRGILGSFPAVDSHLNLHILN